MLLDSDKKHLEEILVIRFNKKEYDRAYWELIVAAREERGGVPIDDETERRGLEELNKAIPQGSKAVFEVFKTFVDGLMSSGAIQTSMILKDFLSKNEKMIKQDNKLPKSDNFSKGLILTGSILLSAFISKALGE